MKLISIMKRPLALPQYLRLIPETVLNLKQPSVQACFLMDSQTASFAIKSVTVAFGSRLPN
jgi:hypothetical protein